MGRMAGMKSPWLWPGLAMSVAVFALAALAADRHDEVVLDEARIYIEFNASANDLGFHVFVDGEDWRRLKITNPRGRPVFSVEGRGAFGALGLTELFFEGAEPSLDEFPLDELLARFPEGEYEFVGRTAASEAIHGVGTLSHAVPAAPEAVAMIDADDAVSIHWEPVTSPADGFDGPIEIVGYQVLLDSFQVTLPASATSVTLPPELVASLEAGEHDFEVLAIDASGNRTIAEGALLLD